MALAHRTYSKVVFGLRQSSRAFSSSVRSHNYPTTTDNPVPVNTNQRAPQKSNTSQTNALPTSPTHGRDAALVEDPAEGEEKRIQQAPNRAGIWSRSQRPREEAMVGPRFEQMNVDYQPRPLAAIELIHKQPVRWTKESQVSCDGGGGPLGHPRIFINVNKPQICWCTYCGVPFVYTSVAPLTSGRASLLTKISRLMKATVLCLKLSRQQHIPWSL